MDQKKDDDKKPAIPIPTLKDSKNAPQLKIKGLAQGGLSLMERLKQFKKKDLAFILAGLGVLFLAPLAEHFMMAPEGDSGSLQGGFGGRGDGGVFGKGSTPYEGGVNGLAPGGLAGGGSDVITPLNVRDPAALVMGPGATQQPPATSAPAPAAPSKSDSSDWKDALAQSAAKAAPAAAKAAALPVPKIPLSAGGLRGLGAVSGGGGGSYSLPGISAANVPNRGNVNSSPSPTGGGGIRGVGARGEGQGGNPNSLDALKKAAQNAANVFNQPGSASSNLEQAAKTQFGDGSGGGGAGEGGGAGDKASGQSGDKGSKNADGQSLAFLKAKQEQEKAIEFEWKKKEAGDLDLMWFKLRDKMAEEAIMTPFKAITGMMAKQIGKLGTNSASTYECYPSNITDASKAMAARVEVTEDQVSPCGTTTNSNDVTSGSQAYFAYGDDRSQLWVGACGQGTPLSCTGKSGSNTPPTPPGNGYGTGTGSGVWSAQDYKSFCDNAGSMTAGVSGGKSDPNITGAVNALVAVGKDLSTLDGALNTGSSSNLGCGATAIANAGSGTNILDQLGVDATGKPTSKGTLNTLTLQLTALENIAKKDNKAISNVVVDSSGGSGGGHQSLAQIIDGIRQNVDKLADDTTVLTPPVDPSGVKSIVDGAKAGDGANTFSDKGADDAALAGVMTALKGDPAKSVQGQLTTLKQELTDALAVANRANATTGDLKSAQSALTTLNGSNADVAKALQKNYDQMNAAYGDLTTKLQASVAEFNRQADPANGVLKQELALQPQVKAVNDAIWRDVINGQPAAAGTNGIGAANPTLTQLAAGGDHDVAKITNKPTYKSTTGMPDTTTAINNDSKLIKPFVADSQKAQTVYSGGDSTAPNAPNLSAIRATIGQPSTADKTQPGGGPPAN